MESLDENISSVYGCLIGTCAKVGILENCSTVWEGFCYLHDATENISSSSQTWEWTLSTLSTEIEAKISTNGAPAEKAKALLELSKGLHVLKWGADSNWKWLASAVNSDQ